MPLVISEARISNPLAHDLSRAATLPARSAGQRDRRELEAHCFARASSRAAKSRPRASRLPRTRLARHRDEPATRRRFAERGLAGRCAFVTGDFFKSIPSGAGVYVLKSVIHDWNDEQARAILTVCRAAMSRDARLELVERLMPERVEPTPEHQAIALSDLNMLVTLGARERTAVEFDALLAQSGFARTRCVAAGPTHSVLEASPM